MTPAWKIPFYSQKFLSRKIFSIFMQNLELRKIVQKNITKQLNQNRSKRSSKGPVIFFSGKSLLPPTLSPMTVPVNFAPSLKYCFNFQCVKIS